MLPVKSSMKSLFPGIMIKCDSSVLIMLEIDSKKCSPENVTRSFKFSMTIVLLHEVSCTDWKQTLYLVPDNKINQLN